MKMKNLHNFIQERLVINSKSKINQYTCQPKDKAELRRILRERLDKDKNADLNDIDVSKIIDMSFLFENMDPHNIDISEWDVSNVENMLEMFYMCQNFNSDLSKWDVSNVKNMKLIFGYARCFTGEGLDNWDISNVIYMTNMFVSAKNAKIPNWYMKIK